ncbi:hypothetical protein ACLB1S_03480 [Escherichia coli]
MNCTLKAVTTTGKCVRLSRRQKRRSTGFNQLKTNKSEPRRPLRKMVFNVPTRRELTSGERAIQHGLAIATR